MRRVPFVSFLHTGETVPTGSDPVLGKSETSFCFISAPAREMKRNHGAAAARVTSIQTGDRRYGWCIMI